jgi:hypothetical protein
MDTVPDQKNHGTPSARTWFAGGERVGYHPEARAIVVGRGAPLKVFLKREGDLTDFCGFFRMAIEIKAEQSDLDSTIPRFESWRPSH